MSGNSDEQVPPELQKMRSEAKKLNPDTNRTRQGQVLDMFERDIKLPGGEKVGDKKYDGQDGDTEEIYYEGE